MPVSRLERSGFTLTELMVALTIVGMIMVLTIVNLKPQQTDSQSRALATMVASQLNLARQSAITANSPVAVIIPSGGGSVPYSQSLYIASGESQAHVSRVVNYAKDFDQAVIFQGQWPLATSTATINPPTFGARPALFSPSSWLTTAMRTDYCLIFTPDGSVVSNGLPFFDGAYHWVSSVGAQFTAASPLGYSPAPSPPTFAPTMLGKPWTITISQQGQISIAAGLTGQSGSVLDGGGVGLTPVPALPPAVQSLGASSPVEQLLAVLPPPPSTPPVGSNTTITSDGRASVQLYATDPSARDLYVQWSAVCTSGGAANGGNFSFSGPERMTWDAIHQRWSSTWDWSPPFGTPAGETFHLNCTMGDGVNVTLRPPGQDIKTIPIKPIYFTVMLAPDNHWEVWKINPDGSSPTFLSKLPASVPVNTVTGSVTLSPDASKLVACNNSSLTIFSLPTLAVLEELPLVGQNGYNCGAISPHGDKIAYTRIQWLAPNNYTYSDSSLVVSDVNGSNSQSFPCSGWADSYYDEVLPCAWSPDQTQVLIAPTSTSTWPVSILNISTGAWTNVDTGAILPDFLHWSSDNWIYGKDGLTGKLYRFRPDGSSLSAPIPVPGTTGSFSSYSISPDGSQLVFSDSLGNIWITNYDGSSPVLVTNLITNLGMNYLGWDVILSWGR